jgi:hypothetical protein
VNPAKSQLEGDSDRERSPDIVRDEVALARKQRREFDLLMSSRREAAHWVTLIRLMPEIPDYKSR